MWIWALSGHSFWSKGNLQSDLPLVCTSQALPTHSIENHKSRPRKHWFGFKMERFNCGGMLFVCFFGFFCDLSLRIQAFLYSHRAGNNMIPEAGVLRNLLYIKILCYNPRGKKNGGIQQYVLCHEFSIRVWIKDLSSFLNCVTWGLLTICYTQLIFGSFQGNLTSLLLLKL